MKNHIEAYNDDPQVRRNLAGLLLLTVLLAYYVIFTLKEGYSIAWYGYLGIIVYGIAAWLLVVPARKW